ERWAARLPPPGVPSGAGRRGGGEEAHGGKQGMEPGVLEPDDIHLPGVFVQRVVELTPEQVTDKQVEKRTVRR
ncbi:hypothetical protein ABZT51_50345, partial [Streptomyces sp. NPDC005373]